MNLRAGESVSSILWYWLPELISLFVIIALPPLFDAYLISGMHSTTAYGALGMATNFLHTLVKLSETIPVAAIAVIGRYNGARKYQKCGQELVTTFWTTVVLGGAQCIIIFLSATSIYRWLGVPADMAVLGAPFLRLRSVGVFLTFVLWSLLGFMRAVKNTRVPMLITLMGTIVYICSAALFVQGRGGFPSCGIYGAALAAIIQYTVMLAAAVWYIRNTPAYKKYLRRLKPFVIDWDKISTFLSLSFPVMVDKSALAFSYVWLSKMIAPLGTTAIATFDIIKNLERTALLPAMAFATVVMFLVSNSLGNKDEKGAQVHIAKVLLLGLGMVTLAVGILCWQAPFFVTRISPSESSTALAVPLIRFLSILVIFDFLQLILAGALRGAGNFSAVMWTRISCCLFFFLPISYILSTYSFSSISTKFGLIYGAFYVNTALMGVIFLICLLRTQWYRKKLAG